MTFVHPFSVNYHSLTSAIRNVTLIKQKDIPVPATLVSMSCKVSMLARAMAKHAIVQQDHFAINMKQIASVSLVTILSLTLMEKPRLVSHQVS